MDRSLLSNQELSQVLAEVVAKSQRGQYLAFYPLFLVLYEHGFRVEELRSLHEWVLLPNDLVSCQTSKGGGDRLISFLEFPPKVQQSILDRKNYLVTTSYDTIERAFSHYLPCLRLEVETKSIGCHAFRHNRIKQLEASGIPRSTIKAMFGLQRLETVQHYCESEVFKVSH